MGLAEIAMMTVSGGFGFAVADGLDRFLATYDPSATGAKPTDKFTSDGAGTLANTLNIAAMPNWKRVAAGVGVAAVPTLGAMYVRNPLARASFEGMAVGAGISAFKTFWNNVLMPMLIGKDTSASALQNSYIARLYPAEVAAHISRAAQKGADGKIAPGPYAAAGVLSDAPDVGVGDVGPFALAADSAYPDAATALGYGLRGDSPYPDAAQALRSGVSGDSPYPDAGQALRRAAGLSAGPPPTGGPDSSWQPGPPPGIGPGPQARPHNDCGCVGDEYAGFLGGAPEEEPLYSTG